MTKQWVIFTESLASDEVKNTQWYNLAHQASLEQQTAIKLHITT